MNISVVGTGYVGLVVGACLAETGNSVVGADVDAEKIEGLTHNVLPIYEPGLDRLVERNQAAGRLRFTTNVPDAVAGSDVVFIAVGTPPDEDGSADLRHVLAVADVIGRHMTRELVIVTKSTVPVGTASKVAEAVSAHAQHPFHVVSNPEFLKEGAAVDDFMKPDRVVLGAETDHARSVMAELYAPFVRTGKPIVFMDIPSAEMTKYAANAMLATRISFMNDIANLCEQVGANIDLVRKGIGSDARIGPAFLFPGPGYGGSCFPKDVKALVKFAGDRIIIGHEIRKIKEDVSAIFIWHDQRKAILPLPAAQDPHEVAHALNVSVGVARTVDADTNDSPVATRRRIGRCGLACRHRLARTRERGGARCGPARAAPITAVPIHGAISRRFTGHPDSILHVHIR